VSVNILPSIVLGHNQFFGVDHLSSQRGAERAAHFSNIANVMQLLHVAKQHGAGGVMLSTHPRAIAICEQMRHDGNFQRDFSVFPLLPYAQKYVTRANEVGLVRAATATLTEASLRDRMGLGGDFLKIFFRRDPLDLVRSLMRLELRMFRELSIPVVFLHDAISDLLLSLSAPRVFELYGTTLRRRFGSRMGIATKNLPLLVDRFTHWGLELPVVLTHVNAAGFHVNPNLAACETILHRPDLDVMAMGTLASGFLAPSEAFAYTAKFPAVKSVVIGASTEEHIVTSFHLVSKVNK
jgi:hypothetical protein